MPCASITFDAEVEKQKCHVTLEVFAEYRKPIPAEAMRQLLVQVAIKLTNPDELDNLVAELVPLKPTIGGKAKAELAPPLLRPKLNLLKKKPPTK